VKKPRLKLSPFKATHLSEVLAGLNAVPLLVGLVGLRAIRPAHLVPGSAV
jgi:hypothetical protein